MKDLNIGGKYSFSGFGYFSPAFTVTAQWAMSMEERYMHPLIQIHYLFRNGR